MFGGLATKNKKALLIAVLAGILLLFLLNLYQSQVRNFFYLISEPIQKKLWADKNQEEDTKLRQQLQELSSTIARISEAERENVILREALKIGLQEEFTLIFGQVTGKNISEDSLIVNRGAKEGLRVNLPVVTEQKVLVGKVEEVFENFSRVQLISNKKPSFDARLLGREIQGLIKGHGNLKVTLDLVPQYEEVKEGELLVTTALGGIFPSGLLVGYVKSVKRSDVEPFQQIEITPAFDLKQLDYLFIISP